MISIISLGVDVKRWRDTKNWTLFCKYARYFYSVFLSILLIFRGWNWYIPIFEIFYS